MSAKSDSVPDEVHEAIMEATYHAVCASGYADMTMQDIAEEAGKSKSLLHYHYDTKEGLLVAFLEHMLGRFEAEVEEMDGESPTERLDVLLCRMSPDEGDEDRRRFHRALLELRTQAPCREAYREQLRRNKAAIQNRFAAVVRDGVERGEFRDVDPERAARFALAALDGARNSFVAFDDAEEPRAVRESIRDYLLVDGAGVSRESDLDGDGERSEGADE